MITQKHIYQQDQLLHLTRLVMQQILVFALRFKFSWVIGQLVRLSLQIVLISLNLNSHRLGSCEIAVNCCLMQPALPQYLRFAHQEYVRL